MKISVDDWVYIGESQISQTGFAKVIQVWKTGITVEFEDTGKIGIYTSQRSVMGLFPSK